MSDASIDAFIDALWLEEGLSRNTLAAYRRDLSLYAGWLAGQGKALDGTAEADLNGYFAARHSASKATTANRRLTVFKRYFRWALRERLVAADPTLRLQSARQPLRVPRTLAESQVEALLDAPDVDTPLGLRDRTMLELMYASGLRVSELVGLKTFNVSMSEHVLRVFGKGNKERLVPFGQVARDWIVRYLARGAARDPRRPADGRPVRHGARAGHDARHVLGDREEARARRGHHRAACRRTRCAMRSPPTCSITAPTCAPCRCCSAMRTSPPPPSTPMWRASA